MNATSSVRTMNADITSQQANITPLPDRQGMTDDERKLAIAFRERYAAEVEGLVVRHEVENPLVTLIVVSFRAGDYLLDCLRHLRAQTVAQQVRYEILLADSGGLDHLRDRYGNLVDVDLRLRYGLPLNVARNAAMAYARGEFVAIIDDDGLVAPDWLEQALAVFRDSTIIAARGRIRAHEHPYLNTYAAHYDRGDELWDEGSVSLEGNMMVRRCPYLQVGGFPDELYGSEGLYLGYLFFAAFPDKRSVYAPGMLMRHDYCRSMREFVWKCRKYRNIASTVGKDDPGFTAYRMEHRKKRKPQRKYTFTERVTRELMVTAERIIVRVSLFDHVNRR
jgi:glycosyltransferase involved in cell wall biosynthesis